jgi:multicomponent Na+:H+ antiporter subunit E
MLALWFLFNLSWDWLTIVSGVIISALMTMFASYVLYDERGFKFRGFSLPMVVRYGVTLIIEIFKSAFQYIGNIIRGDAYPLVFDLKVDVDDDLKVALIANSITLTPGTVSIDVNDKVITVLAIVKKGTSVDSIAQPIRDKFEHLLRKKS